MTTPAPAIEIRSITKRFGAVTACDRVDLSARRGEIHGVLGQNGAGKTTLMNVLVGLTRPDAGEVLIDGHRVTIDDPVAASRLGLAMVHQHFSLIGPLTVWENVTLGEQVGSTRPPRWRASRRPRSVTASTSTPERASTSSPWGNASASRS